MVIHSIRPQLIKQNSREEEEGRTTRTAHTTLYKSIARVFWLKSYALCSQEPAIVFACVCASSFVRDIFSSFLISSPYAYSNGLWYICASVMLCTLSNWSMVDHKSFLYFSTSSISSFWGSSIKRCTCNKLLHTNSVRTYLQRTLEDNKNGQNMRRNKHSSISFSPLLRFRKQEAKKTYKATTFYLLHVM